MESRSHSNTLPSSDIDVALLFAALKGTFITKLTSESLTPFNKSIDFLDEASDS